MIKQIFIMAAGISILCIQNTQAQTKKKVVAKKTTTTVAKKKVPAKTTTATAKNSNSTNSTTSTTITINTNTNNTEARKQKNTDDPLNLNLGKGAHITKGKMMVDLGVGFNYYGIPLHFGAEKLIADDISVGIFGNYVNYSPIGFLGSSYSYNLIYAGVKGNYYFNHLIGYGSEKYQLYAGLNIGYAVVFTGDNSFSGYRNRPFLGGQVGGRYFLNKKIGIYAEGDYSGASGGTIGVTIKMK